MWTSNRLLVLATLLALTASALAQNIGGGIENTTGVNGIGFAPFGAIGGPLTGGAAPPGACSGVVDLSAGCALPMLHGAP